MLYNDSFESICTSPYILYNKYMINSYKDGYAMSKFTNYSTVLNRKIYACLSVKFRVFPNTFWRCLLLEN